MRFYRLAFALIIGLNGCAPKDSYQTKTGESAGYQYEYVENDPLHVRIYTLKNGLKVYLSQYDAEPRLQAQIVVRAGGKNDPAETTGLAHYLEHIMFKGTADFGTLDWATESTLLDSIERYFEVYRTIKDSMARVQYYRKIDQKSNEASRFAIANEYDKMTAEIGARGTNASTTEDRTVYVNDVPANQLENFFQIEANRFKKIVPRLFHTELETVYEEKNRSLDNDEWKSFEALHAALFPTHPYGTQTVIGTIEHLKNPSITNIKKYFDTYYRPNNVAICLSGDLQYDSTIAMIDKYFGDWKPNEKLPVWKKTEEAPLEHPVVKEILGPDAEWVNIGFRFDGRNSRDYQLLRLTDDILSNSQAGLIDLNLKQQQKVLDASSTTEAMTDYSIHTFTGKPRDGQTLEQVKDLLLQQIELVKKGEFDDWMLTAVVNDLKKNKIRQSENNFARSTALVEAFADGIDWKSYVTEVDQLRTFTKQDVIDFANKHYGNNYAVIYKRNGKEPIVKKVTKPEITRVTLNKEARSPFHEAILNRQLPKIKPVFVDYEEDIQSLTMQKGIPVLYTPNKENDLFTLFYLSQIGTNNNPMLGAAVEYLEYLGTPELSAADVKKEFYKLGCDFGVFAAEDQTYIYLTGLHENMDAALKLFENLLANAKPDDKALANMIEGSFRKREDRKKDKSAILYEGLINYGLYGPRSPFTNVLSNKELRSLKAEQLTSLIKEFTQSEHQVLYYGPASTDQLLSTLEQHHAVPDLLKPLPKQIDFVMQDVKAPQVFWTDYDMVQAEIIFLAKGPQFDKTRIPYSRLFNEYFDGNMSSPIFQELREAQGLAYSAFAFYGTADKPNGHDYFFAYIGTQADKQKESMKGLSDLIRQFPRTENGFEVARSGLLSRIESERITKTGILFNYLTAKRRGLDHDIRKDVYEEAMNATIEDVARFHEQFVKDAHYNVVLLANKNKIDFQDLQKYGNVREVTLDELFGYEKSQKINVEKPH